MRTYTTFPLGWTPILAAIFLVGCLAGALVLATWFVDEELTPPEEVTTPLERDREEALRDGAESRKEEPSPFRASSR